MIFQIRAVFGWLSYLALAIGCAWFGFAFIWTDIDQQVSKKELHKQYSQASYLAIGKVVGVGAKASKSSKHAYAIIEVQLESDSAIFRFESRDLAIGDIWTSPYEAKGWLGEEKNVECLRMQPQCRLKLKNREINDNPITFMSVIGAIFAISGGLAVIGCFTGRREIIEKMVYRMRRKSLENFKP